MIEADDFMDAAQARGFGLWTGVPCSYLQPFIDRVAGSDRLAYVPASNEGDAVAIAAGSEVAGTPAIAMMQNSGLGNAVNPLTSLAFTHRIPMLLIVTLRGEPGGPADEPQHALMGSITLRMLELMQIRWDWFPEDAQAVEACLDEACAWMRRERLPYCLVMRKGAVASVAAPARRSGPPCHAPAAGAPAGDELAAHPAVHTRREVLAFLQQATGPRDVLLATTGYTGRELCALADRPEQLYLVGAMGCASSMGLGMALAQPDLRIVVLDGDGALLMRMGALAAIGRMAPPNLVHVLLDNGVHESTGGQETVSRSVQIGAIARACGYRRVRVVSRLADLEQALGDGTGLSFLRLPIVRGVPADLPRPAITPVEATDRLRAHLRRPATEETP
jgi:phosphonopyruvate decarboxylase